MSGQNAAFTDIGDRILSNSPKFLLYIIGVTFLLLAMAFRSLVVALKAALTTLISALVGFGVLVFVVQMGHGMGVIGLDRTGPIESFVPPIAFAIIFGLSMDYEVFLMSRIREEHVHGADTLNAVRDGVSGVGRVIVAAALIMATVFFAFMLNPDRVTKEFGLLLGVAILTDALLVRMTLVPSLLTLLGERSWAMPGWLDRILPNLTIEPPSERSGGPHARAGAGRGRLGDLGAAQVAPLEDGDGRCEHHGSRCRQHGQVAPVDAAGQRPLPGVVEAGQVPERVEPAGERVEAGDQVADRRERGGHADREAAVPGGRAHQHGQPAVEQRQQADAGRRRRPGGRRPGRGRPARRRSAA